MTIPEHLEQFFDAHPVPHGGTLVAAVSGGADSLAMLFALAEERTARGFDVRVAYLHHGMRDAADADAEALRGICDTLGAPLEIGYADVPAMAAERRVSLEVAGRVARYDFLYEAAHGVGASGICTGHTLDDQAETVLLRVIAGTGLEGLGGIAPARLAVPSESRSPVWLLRPLLGVSRAETVAFCAERGLSPVEDPYNEDRRYPRNRIRGELIPLLERDFNPLVRNALSRLAEFARTENALLEGLADDALPIETTASGALVARAPFLALSPPLQRRVARRFLRAAGGGGRALRFANVERLLAAVRAGTRRVCLEEGLTLEIDAERAQLVPTPPIARKKQKNGGPTN
jgi:tRNA(Ile)-lysidine synthase